jgi:predicted CXXCH cytochrome family protein
MRLPLAALLVLLAACSTAPKTPSQHPANSYVDPKLCAGCHAAIAASYSRTAMAHAFFRALPANMMEDFDRRNSFFHKPSGRYYRMIRRDGRFFLRRHQISADGKETNVVEKEIHYVMGSGHHARSYIHRTANNELLELPVTWYAEKGGYWGMSPGYDRPAHPDFRRRISYDCMFCHNAYPAPAEYRSYHPVFPLNLPEGIDCQRCHGPGQAHVAAASRPGAAVDAVRASIVNPKRLSAERQLEVCMQCHLETTSFSLPNSIVRYDRGPFGYIPGEPLAEFQLHFDHAPGSGRENKFEIVSAAYRLRQSRCFRESQGKLLCTTCHNPHQAASGEEATRQYRKACEGCHAGKLSAAHPAGADCASCHMPRRRTEDVIHAVMTDHRIVAKPPFGNLLAERIERPDGDYRGEVVPYYPTNPPELYAATAQVKQRSNLKEGIARLEQALRRLTPTGPEFYFDLAQAYLSEGRQADAIRLYREALRHAPDFVPALRSLGAALTREGQPEEAWKVLGSVPGDATAAHERGLALQRLGRTAEAVAALEEACRLDPDFPEAFNSLGGVYFEAKQGARAAEAFREAVRIRPDYAEAHNNLANVLQAEGDFPHAREHYETAIGLQPQYAAAHFNYGGALIAQQRFAEAEKQLEAAVQQQPDLAEAQELLGNLLVRRGAAAQAAIHFEAALRRNPSAAGAHFGLAAVLAAQGDRAGAESHLREAAKSTDPLVRRQVEALRNLLMQNR